MHSLAVPLLVNSALVGAGAAVTYQGGRTVLVSRATTYPGTSTQLQIQTQDGTWITFQAATTADGVTAGFDAPAGNYRIFTAGTAPAGLYMSLVRVPY